MLKLKELRKLKGKTQEEISKVIGITRAAYTNIENGKREADIKTLLQLANYYNVSLEYLTTGKEIKFSDENAHLVAKLRNDIELTEALKKYFDMDEEKRKLIIATINALSEKKEEML